MQSVLGRGEGDQRQGHGTERPAAHALVEDLISTAG
jgi:hypothetical protein